MARSDLVRALVSLALLLFGIWGLLGSTGWTRSPPRPFVSWVFVNNLSYKEIAFSSGSAQKHNVRPEVRRTGNQSSPKPRPTLPDLVMLKFDDRSALEPFRPSPAQNPSGVDYWSASRQLVADSVPSILHFLWCGTGWFEFPHYLVVMSALRAIRPFKVMMHYHQLPEMDDQRYNLWMNDLKHDFPFFELNRMKVSERVLCQDTSQEIKLHTLAAILDEHGGIYVGMHTWLLDFPPSMRNGDLDWSLYRGTMEGYIIMRKGLYQANSLEVILGHSRPPNDEGHCTSVDHFYQTGKRGNCLVVTGRKFEHFYPNQIWELDNGFGKLARLIFYGTEIKRPKPTFEELVPNIAHMVWIGGGEMKLSFYLSVLSLLYVVKVDVVYIHGDKQPVGQHWDKLKPHKRVIFVNRPAPTSLFQNKVSKNLRPLMSDLIRVDLMVKYGGIYTDTDAIWVKPLSREERAYDAVASFDWVGWSAPYPDTINFGVSYGKKNAPFWRVFQDSMRTLHNADAGFTGVRMPYKLLERYPDLLRIDPHLQVICYHLKCHPTWVKDYHNEAVNHVTNNTLQNWMRDVHALHFTWPDPPAFTNITQLIKSHGLFADVGKFVLKQAGLL